MIIGRVYNVGSMSIKADDTFDVLEISTDQQAHVQNWGGVSCGKGEQRGGFVFAVYHATSEDLHKLAQTLEQAAIKIMARDEVVVVGQTYGVGG